MTHFVAGLGTSGTFVGAAARLRLHRPVGAADLRCSPNLRCTGSKGLKHMATAIVPGIYDSSLADEDLRVSTERAYDLTRRLAAEEGMLVGVSSGAALAASLDVAARVDEGVIVTVFPDSGSRYLTERFWDGGR